MVQLLYLSPYPWLSNLDYGWLFEYILSSELSSFFSWLFQYFSECFYYCFLNAPIGQYFLAKPWLVNIRNCIKKYKVNWKKKMLYFLKSFYLNHNTHIFETFKLCVDIICISFNSICFHITKKLNGVAFRDSILLSRTANCKKDIRYL